MLSGAQRSEARQALQELTDDDDSRIAQLAQAQLWRTQRVTAGPVDLVRWRAAVKRMPESLRAGPYLLLGQLHSRLKQPEQAAVAFMRTPVLFPHQTSLASQSLLAAAGEFETMGRPETAGQLYRQLIREHPQSPFIDEARRRLQSLQEKRPDSTDSR